MRQLFESPQAACARSAQSNRGRTPAGGAPQPRAAAPAAPRCWSPSAVPAAPAIPAAGGRSDRAVEAPSIDHRRQRLPQRSHSSEPTADLPAPTPSTTLRWALHPACSPTLSRAGHTEPASYCGRPRLVSVVPMPYVRPRLRLESPQVQPLTTSVRTSKPGVGGAFPPPDAQPTPPAQHALWAEHSFDHSSPAGRTRPPTHQGTPATLPTYGPARTHPTANPGRAAGCALGRPPTQGAAREGKIRE